MKYIIGSSGLIGQTISEKIKFDFYFNTKNIHEYNKIVMDGSELFLTCLPATKWLVNNDLKKDMDNINFIIDTISKHTYSKVTLISTIDIYNDSPFGVNEDYSPNVSKLSYGNNRYIFELLVKEYVKTDNLKIFRLPALYNNKIKKNILYDFINNNNVENINVNSSYQWYNLDNLSMDIDRYNEYYPSTMTFNLFSEPLHTWLILDMFPQYKDFIKHGDFIMYDYKTKYNSNMNGYICDYNSTLLDIKKFINEFSHK